MPDTKPIGGTYTLTIGAHQSKPIAHNAPNEYVQAAITQLYAARADGIRIARTLKKRHRTQR